MKVRVGPWRAIVVCSAFWLLKPLAAAEQIPDFAGASIAIRSAFLKGDSEACLRLATEQINRSRAQGNQRPLLEALTWRGLGLTRHELENQAEQAWLEATEIAERLNERAMQARLIGMRALWMAHFNPEEAEYLWTDSLKVASEAKSTEEAAQCEDVMNCLGFAQARNPFRAGQAFKKALELSPKSDASALKLAVERCNLAIASLQVGRFQTDADSIFKTAETNLESVLGTFKATPGAGVGVAFACLNLAWAADSLDDLAAASDWKDQFQKSIEPLSPADLAGLRGSDNYLIFIPHRDSDPTQVLGHTEVKLLERVPDPKRPPDAPTALIAGLVATPIKRFVEAWGTTERWNEQPSQPMPDPDRRLNLTRTNRSTPYRMDTNQMAIALSGMSPDQIQKLRQLQTMIPSQQAKMLEEMLRANDDPALREQIRQLRQRSPAALRKLLPPGIEMTNLVNPMAGFEQGQLLDRLPGPSRFAPLPSMRIPPPTVAGLELNDSPELYSGMLLTAWAGCRDAAYGQIPKGGLRISGEDYSIAMAMLEASALSPLARAKEINAAFQIADETRATEHRRYRRLREFLARPESESTRKPLRATQAESLEAYFEYFRRWETAPSNRTSQSFKATTALWARSGRYNETIQSLQRANFQEAPPLPSTVETAQALPQGCVFVEFANMLSDTGNDYIFLIDPRNNPQRPEILLERSAIPRALAIRFQNLVSNPALDAANLAPIGRRLFARLFPGEIGKRMLAASRIVIAPPGDFWSFPFGALVINAEGPPKYLALEKALSYTESIELLKCCRAGEQPTGKFDPAHALVVGNFTFSEENQGPVFERFSQPRSLLPDLGSSIMEIQRVAAVYGTQAISGKTAAESQLRDEMERASIIHINSHGYGGLTPQHFQEVMDVRPLRGSTRAATAGIWLQARNALNSPRFDEDGLLEAWEAKNYALKADLVVLSACDLAESKTLLTWGPELPLAFLYAGAHSVLAAQAPASEKATLKLMPMFHRHIREGLPKDEALRQSLRMIQAIPDFNHPNYWFPFILLGDPDNGLFQRQK